MSKTTKEPGGSGAVDVYEVATANLRSTANLNRVGPVTQAGGARVCAISCRT
jgi:hypothetical protein